MRHTSFIELLENRRLLSVSTATWLGSLTPGATSAAEVLTGTKVTETVKYKVIGKATFNGISCSEIDGTSADTALGSTTTTKSYFGLDKSGDPVAYGDVATTVIGSSTDTSTLINSPYETVFPANMTAGVSYPESWTSNSTIVINPGGMTIKNSETLKVTYKLTSASTESVTVPAGKYNAYLVDETVAVTVGSTTTNSSAQFWAVPGVGQVKTVEGTGPDAITIELTSVGGSTSSAKISVTAPAAQTATAGTAKSFSLGSFSETGATGPYTVVVNWGDGSTNTKFSQSSAGTITAQSHTYTKAATDAVTVTITDSKGNESNVGSFKVTVAPSATTAVKLGIAKQPSAAVAGKAISPAIVVDVENSTGLTLAANTSTVTVSIASGPTGAKLGGTDSAKAVKGVATFSDVLLTKAGTYTLKFSDGTLTAATSTSFKISPAAAAKLAFIQEPTNVTVSKAIAPAVKVAVEDTYGNIVTTDKSSVTLAVDTGPSGSALTGVFTEADSSGVSTFSDLLLKIIGAYTLKATDGKLTGAVSTSFKVS